MLKKEQFLVTVFLVFVPLKLKMTMSVFLRISFCRPRFDRSGNYNQPIRNVVLYILVIDEWTSYVLSLVTDPNKAKQNCEAMITEMSL